jgi:hypothetical protein
MSVWVNAPKIILSGAFAKMQAGIHAQNFLIAQTYREPRSQEQMRRFLKVAKIKDVLKLVMPFLAFLLIGFVIKKSLTGEFWNKTADALIIAGLIGAAIELWSASVLIEHVSRELSERLVGYGLPKTAQAVIAKLVRDSDVVLRNYSAKFNVAHHPSKDHYLLVRLTLSWKALNNSIRSVDYRTGLSDELIYNPQLELLQRGDDTFRSADFPPAHPETTQRSWKAPGIILKSSEASAGPDSLNPDQYCDVCWIYTLEMPERYSTVLSFGAIVIEPEIILDPLPNDVHMKFYANPDPACLHADNSPRWKYLRAFMPEQCIRVWWEPSGDSAQDA